MMESNLETSQDGAQKKITLDDLSRDELLNKCRGLLLIAQKAKQAKSDLLNELENYKIQLSKCETEKKTNHENINTLQELVNSLTEQKLNYITEIDAAHSKIKILSEKCNISISECQKLKTDLSEKVNTIIELSQKQSDLDSEIISLKRQNNRLLEENEQLINQLTELEARSTAFNDIGLQQREQLTVLEQKVQADNIMYTNKLEELNNTIKELENRLHLSNFNEQINIQMSESEGKINELTQLYESEKAQKEKSNLKLKMYKDKILKCAACINQLKNTRFILTKTVKEYSENIPKWQSDIIKASKIMDEKIYELNDENSILKNKLQQLQSDLNELNSENAVILQQSNSKFEENKVLSDEITNLNKQIHDITNSKTLIKGELQELKLNYDELKNSLLPSQLSENKLLRENLNELNQKLSGLTLQNDNLNNLLEQLKSEKSSFQNFNDKETVENLMLQMKALESEKAILVKEKLNARDNLLDVESQNKILSEQVINLRSENQNLQSRLQTLTHEKHVLEEKYKSEKDIEISTLKCQLAELQVQYDLLKKDHNNILDLNGLLKEEVETLKLSLEQPKDEAENLSDLNVSLQADIVKLETKLSGYKQENNSLLTEVKESRAKIKEYDSLVADYESAKSKLSSYKTENTELLTEMKEINQVLKERGEAISKMQKAIDEMESLIDTFEKDRDNLKHEKEELLKRIETLETDLKKAERKKSEDNEEVEKKFAEKETALINSAQKDIIIAALKEEIEKLKQQQSAPELPNEDMSTSTISKAEDHSRMKDLDETFEEKYTKLRIFALKLKKKLNETITQLQNAEQDKAKLEKIINENELTIKQAHVTADEVDFKVENEKSLNVLQISDLEAKVKSLTTAVTSSEKISAELENIKAELAEKTSQLAAEIEAHKITKDNLEKAQRDVKKKNVLSLEMEDYERSMKELTHKMEESKKKMVQMESTIDTQEGTLTTMKTQIKLLEEQIKAEETQNRLVKEELQRAIEVRQEKDDMIALKNDIIYKLEQDLEDAKRNKEEAILEITSLLTEKEKNVISLSEDKAELNNKLKRMEFKCGELNEKLRIVKIELEDLKAEYTSYKVRAQAVLRQNQTIDHSQEEQLKEEMAALRAQVEALTTKLATAEERCAEAGADVESWRRRAAEAGAEAARAQQRTARLHADLERLTQQVDSERAQHKLQISTLTQCYKTQISELETKHQKEKEELNKQLMAARDSAQPGEAAAAGRGAGPLALPAAAGADDASDGEMDINVSMIPREEGEGSEAAPSPPPLKGYAWGGEAGGGAGAGAGGRRSPVPLERLLEEGVPDDEALPGAAPPLPPDQELADLRRKLHAQQQRVKHVTLLLAESEREGARLAQLSELLKAELRRVRGAAPHAHNTEYMKNVTLKFLTLPPGDERSRLVPVLQQILTLTNDETHKIQAIAKGLDPNPSKGWGSYLPWPGGK